MRILVVGSGTFWGRPLVDQLRSQGAEVAVFSRDPRTFPDDWRMSLSCYWGELTHGHLLDQALQGIDRVVACVGAGKVPAQGDSREVEGIRSLLCALGRHPRTDLLRLTSPAPLHEADWWPMASRRRADVLVESSRIPHCLVHMGWAPEMLAPLLRGTRLWLPHPRSTPGRIAWQSRKAGVAALARLALAPQIPDRCQVRGTDGATVAELSTQALVRNPHLQRIYLPGRLFHWLAHVGNDFGFAGWRLVQGTSSHHRRLDPQVGPSLADWPPRPA